MKKRKLLLGSLLWLIIGTWIMGLFSEYNVFGLVLWMFLFGISLALIAYSVWYRILMDYPTAIEFSDDYKTLTEAELYKKYFRS